MSRYDYDYDYDRPARRNTYRCGGWASYYGPCGATDCESCYPGGCAEDEDREEEATTSRIVKARKARYVGTFREIRPGDKVRVTSGFNYQPGGPRTGYLPKDYHRVMKGPAWAA